MRSTPRGIDVTAHNGVFDWAAWKGHIDFGMVMATRTIDIVDAQFINNWDMMSSMELVRFAFHWYDPAEDPAAQAHHFYQTVHEGGLSEYDGVVLYVDSEDTWNADVVNDAFALYVFCQELQALSGHEPIIMADHYMTESGYCAKLGEYSLWIIDYDTPVPHIAGPWHTWDFWQYGGNNVGQSVFNGTARELDKI